MKGKRVEAGIKLENFNTKLQPETKSLIDAIVITKVMGICSKREFIEKSLELFRKEYPDNMIKADHYLDLMRQEVKVNEGYGPKSTGEQVID